VRAFLAGFLVMVAVGGAAVLVVSEVDGGGGGGSAAAAGHRPGEGSGFDRQMNALDEGLASDDLGTAFREQAAQGIYGMGSDDADRRVAEAVAQVAADVRSGKLQSIDDVSHTLSDALDRLGYDETFDTVVTDHIHSALEDDLRAAGMDPDGLDLTP
jgi:hypothetical protein